MSQKSEPIVILGIDPGTCKTGYGAIRVHHLKHEPLAFGCIRPPQHLTNPQKHLIIFDALEQLIEKYKPCAVAVETQFVYKNVQSAIKLGMARGVAMLAASRKHIPVFEYTPKKAKLAVVGTGSASKEQVQRMIQLLLSLSAPPTPEDAADALALAICHAHAAH